MDGPYAYEMDEVEQLGMALSRYAYKKVSTRMGDGICVWAEAGFCLLQVSYACVGQGV